MYLFLVLILAIVVLLFFSFYFGSMVQNVQESFNPQLGADTWATPEHFNTFYLATTLMTNVWTYIFAFIFFSLMYFAYLYTQRRGVA